MLKIKHLAIIFLVLCVTFVVFGGGVRLQIPGKPGSDQKRTERSFEHFPIVDFDSKEPNDPELRAAREAKGRKYSQRYLPKISESTDQLFSTADWDRGLPAIPTARSAAIVTGTVTKAEAHLTEDRTAIYSEFTVLVDSIAKNDVQNPISVGQTTVFERNGGRVRMPSGKIIVSFTNNQNMPQLGSRYVFFLTHEFETKGDAGKNFYLLTAYRIQSGRVEPLDDTASGRLYKDAEESVFLKELSASLGMR